MSSAPRVLVIGAGVIGLTTALSLLKRRALVTILADRFAPDITSVVAGALWEWPPAVCGYHHDELSLSRSKEWCMESYRKFSELARSSTRTGVFMRRVVFYFRSGIAPGSPDALKMEELQQKVLEFRHDAKLIREYGVNPSYGVVDAYAHLAPMIDTDVYMRWLQCEVAQWGGVFVREHVSRELDACWPDLSSRFSSEIIVNCTGLGAKELGDSSVYPLRGALVRVLSSSTSPIVDAAHCVSHDESQSKQDIVFIVPRGNNLLVLGGLAEPNEWSKEINLDNYEPIREMYKRCVDFLPILKSAALDESEPVRVGLRPFRRQNVRLERAARQPIIHCYGHGGAGVTLSWGCAREVGSFVFGSPDE